jgi:hypothetical protein
MFLTLITTGILSPLLPYEPKIYEESSKLIFKEEDISTECETNENDSQTTKPCNLSYNICSKAGDDSIFWDEFGNRIFDPKECMDVEGAYLIIVEDGGNFYRVNIYYKRDGLADVAIIKLTLKEKWRIAHLALLKKDQIYMDINAVIKFEMDSYSFSIFKATGDTLHKHTLILHPDYLRIEFEDSQKIPESLINMRNNNPSVQVLNEDGVVVRNVLRIPFQKFLGNIDITKAVQVFKYVTYNVTFEFKDLFRYTIQNKKITKYLRDYLTVICEKYQCQPVNQRKMKRKLRLK